MIERKLIVAIKDLKKWVKEFERLQKDKNKKDISLIIGFDQIELIIIE